MLRHRDTISLALVALSLVVGVAWLGGATRWAACAVALACLLSVIPTLKSSRGFERWPVLLLFLLATIGLTLLQLLPLPEGLVSFLSPATHDLVSSSVRIAGESVPAFLPLTLDWPGTMVELAKLLGYLAFAYSALRIARKEPGRRLLLVVFAGIASGLALVSLAHQALGLQELMGFYEPSTPVRDFLGPLINPNHRAGLLAMGACVSLGLCLQANHLRFRIIWLGCFLLCLMVCLFLRSRGATVAVAVGVFTTFGLWWYSRDAGKRRRKKRSRWQIWGPLIVLAACGISLVINATWDDVEMEMGRDHRPDVVGETGKVAAWKSSLTLVREFSATGVGRGAFEPAFTRVNDAAHRSTFSHVENEYLQAVIDWGVPGAFLLFVLLARFIAVAVPRATGDPMLAGAAGACVALGMQSTVDFGTALSGMALMSISLLACLTHVPLAPMSSRRQLLQKKFVVSGLALGLLVTGMAASTLGRSAREDGAILREALVAKVARHELDALGHSMMRRHPVDYYIPAQLAASLFDRRDSKAVAHANHALYLHPKHYGLRELVAEMLVSGGMLNQACSAYRQAAGTSDDLRALIAKIQQELPSRWTQCLPGDREQGLLALRILKSNKKAALAYALTLTEQHPDAAALWQIRGDLELSIGATSIALKSLAEAHRIEPSARTATSLGRAYSKSGDRQSAVKVLQAAIDRALKSRIRVNLMIALAQVHVEHEQLPVAKEVLQSALNITGAPRKIMANVHLNLAKVEQRLGNTNKAAWERARAKTLSQP